MPQFLIAGVWDFHLPDYSTRMPRHQQTLCKRLTMVRVSKRVVVCLTALLDFEHMYSGTPAMSAALPHSKEGGSSRFQTILLSNCSLPADLIAHSNSAALHSGRATLYAYRNNGRSKEHTKLRQQRGGRALP